MVKFGKFLLGLTVLLSLSFFACSNNLEMTKPETGTLVVGGSAGRAIEVNTIKTVDVKVAADDITTPIEKKNIEVSGGRGSFSIGGIPVGKNRVVSVSAKDASGSQIAGGTMYAVTDIVAGDNAIGTITWTTSRKGIVYSGLLNGGVRISALSTADVAKIDAAIPEVAPENILVDEFVADWNNGSGTLKDKAAYIKSASEKTLSYIELKEASELAFSATAHYTDGTSDDVTSKATWKSSFSSIASVSGGKVTLVAAGETDVTASLEGKISNAAKVRVTAAGGNIDKLYFVPNGWDVANAWFAAYFFGGEGAAVWKKMEKSGDKYVCDKPNGSKKVIFVRMNPASTELNFDGKWTQTGDLDIPADKDTFKPSKLEDKITDAWLAELSGTYGGGSLSATITLDEVVVPAKPVVTISSTDVKLNGSITITVKSATAVSGSVKIGGVTKTLTNGANTFAVSDFTSTAGTLSITGSVENDLGATQISETITVADNIVSSKIPSDPNELRIYQVMVASFQDGDPNIGYRDMWGPSNQTKGGDLQGIINAVPYIRELGCNALWMTPIFESGTGNEKLDATGYFAQDYFNIDDQFGTMEKFDELVELCHSNGIAVILDGVFGHNKGYVTPSPSRNGIRNPGITPDTANPVNYASNPNSIKYYSDVARYWITEHKIDGWRFDQCYQLAFGENALGNIDDNCNTGGHNYWYDIRKVVEEAASQNGTKGQDWGTLGYMVGEHWRGAAETIQNGSVVAGNAQGYGLNSCFDFPAYYKLVQGFAQEWSGKSTGNIGEALSYTYQTYSQKGYSCRDDDGSYDPYYPNLMLSNHDLFRIGDLINKKHNTGFDSDAYIKRNQVLLAAMCAYTGPITIYYGDEIGDENATTTSGWGDDNVARSSGKISGFNNREQKIHDYVAKLMQMRAENEVMWNGSHSTLKSESSYFVGKKTLGSDEVIFIINNGSNSVSWSCSGTDLITGESVSGTVSCDGLSARFIKTR